jgi:hypothetical protein
MKLHDNTLKKQNVSAKVSFICDYCQNKVTDIHPINITKKIIKKSCCNCLNQANKESNTQNYRK